MRQVSFARWLVLDRCIRRCLTFVLLVLAPPIASALIHLGSSDHLLPPTVPGTEDLGRRVGELQTSAAPGFLGTPIGPRHFLTAAHIVFAAGEPFLFQGRTYTITHRTHLPNSDLAVATVDADFPEFTPLYDRDDEVRRTVVILGKGRWKGEPVVVEGALKGWRYADSGIGGVRWGTNVIDGSVVSTNTEPGELAGDFLTAHFDRGGGDDEVHFSVGDSGSPLFIADCGVWKLAGVASAVEGPYRPTSDTNVTPFLAALFDVGGLTLVPTDEEPVGFPLLSVPQPSGWFAARVSSKADELRSLAGVANSPIPVAPPALFAALAADGTAAVSLAQAAVTCVDDRSEAGASVQWDGNLARYTAGLPAPALDAFRYIVSGDGARSAWSNVYVVDVSSTGSRPSLRFTPEGTPVLLWPGVGESVVGFELSASVLGPWDRQSTMPTLLDGVALFADPSGQGRETRFYRLVLAP